MPYSASTNSYKSSSFFIFNPMVKMDLRYTRLISNILLSISSHRLLGWNVFINYLHCLQIGYLYIIIYFVGEMFLRKRLLFKPYFRGYTGRILLIEVKTFFKLVWITFSFVLTALPFTKIRYYLLVVTVINVFVCHL